MKEEQEAQTIQGIDGSALVEEYRTYKRVGSYLILGGFLLFIITLSISAYFQSTYPSKDNGKMGVHLLLDDGRNNWDTDLWENHLSYAGQISSSGGIAVQVIRSDDLDSELWQIFMDLASETELSPVLRLATTFDFDNSWWTAPEPDADGSYQNWGHQYADFINSLDWHDAQKQVILLNEVNNGHEWGGVPNPEDYANFIVDVVAILREEVEDIIILNSAFDLNLPDTNGELFPETNVVLINANNYIERMEIAQPGIFSNFDIWNSHPYPLDIRQHPNEQVYRFDVMNGAEDTAITPPEDIYNRGINGYEWELWKLEQLGYDESFSVMITETGWRHSEAIDSDSADSATDYPSPEQVADYFQLALSGGDDVTFTPWLEDERVIAIAPFALNGVPDEWSHTNLVQVTSEGEIIGTYAHFDALAVMSNE